MSLDLEALYDRVRIPAIQREVALRHLPEGEVHTRVINEWVTNIYHKIEKGHNIWLFGDYGTGKSACATLLLKVALSRGKIGYYTSCNNYIRDTMNKTYFEPDVSVYDRCLQVPILCIDELILRERSQQKEVMIEELLRGRLETKQSTIVTTNHNLEFLENNHKSFHSLVSGHFQSVHVRGHNYRKQGLPK